jgi:prolipoprotein diacylglyceryltransferase
MFILHPYGMLIGIGILLAISNILFYSWYTKQETNSLSLLPVIYLSSILGGKLLFFLCDSDFFLGTSFSDFSSFWTQVGTFASESVGGFSILGASFGGIIALIIKTREDLSRNDLSRNQETIIPLSILLIHSTGRIGCFLTPCCQGVIFEIIPLQLLCSAGYFISFIFGMILLKKKIITTLNQSIIYYAMIVCLERFLLDPLRDDSIATIYFFSRYQLIALIYLIVIFLAMHILKKNK